MLRIFAIAFVMVGLTVTADAQTGVKTGEVLPGPFPAYVVFGGEKTAPKEAIQTEERQNFGDASRLAKHHDLVTRFGLDPTVAILTREAAAADDAALGKLIKQLDDAVKKNRNARLHAFTIFLRLKDDFLKDDDRIPQARSIEQFASKSAIQLVPLALDQSESDRTKKWGINSEDQTVVVLYKQHKVTAKFAFTTDMPLDDAGIEAIMKDVKKLIGK